MSLDFDYGYTIPLLEINLHKNDLFPPLFTDINNINGDLIFYNTVELQWLEHLWDHEN